MPDGEPVNASATEESQERRPEAAPQLAGLAVWAAAMVLLPAPLAARIPGPCDGSRDRRPHLDLRGNRRAARLTGGYAPAVKTNVLYRGGT